MNKVYLIASKIYNSPTFTTWGIHAVRFLDVLVIIPILLNYFDSVQIAVFLLFESLFEFSSLLSQRISKTFIRVIAFAHGGAKDLSPIKSTNKRETVKDTDWKFISSIFGTLNSAFIFLAFTASIICLLAGYYGIDNLLVNYPNKGDIWETFIIVCIGTFFTNYFFAHDSFLKGIGLIALSNRNTVIVRLISIFTVFISIQLNLSFLEIIFIIQFFRSFNGLLKVFWVWYSTRIHKAFNSVFNYKLDSKVASSVLEPTWKGMISVISATGVKQLSGMIFTSMAEPSIVASYLFGLRIIGAIGQVSQAPFSSLTPIYAKLRAQNRIDELREKFNSRMRLSLFLFLLLTLIVGVSGSHIFKIIDANIEFLPMNIWFLWSFIFIYERIITFSIAICESGNHVIFYWHEVINGTVTLILILILPKYFGVLGIILAFGLPRLLIFNIGPLIPASRSLNMSLRDFFIRTCSSVLICQLIITILSYAYQFI